MRADEITAKKRLAEHDARLALDRVEKSEGDVAEAWVAYGAALNVGRALFAIDDDYNFGKWKKDNVYSNLEESFTPHPADESAAMWAAANPDDFAAMRTDFPGVRTVRGWHSK